VRACRKGEVWGAFFFCVCVFRLGLRARDPAFFFFFFFLFFFFSRQPPLPRSITAEARRAVTSLDNVLDANNSTREQAVTAVILLAACTDADEFAARAATAADCWLDTTQRAAFGARNHDSGADDDDGESDTDTDTASGGGGDCDGGGAAKAQARPVCAPVVVEVDELPRGALVEYHISATSTLTAGAGLSSDSDEDEGEEARAADGTGDGNAGPAKAAPRCTRLSRRTVAPRQVCGDVELVTGAAWPEECLDARTAAAGTLVVRGDPCTAFDRLAAALSLAVASLGPAAGLGLNDLVSAVVYSARDIDAAAAVPDQTLAALTTRVPVRRLPDGVSLVCEWTAAAQ
jgi:hypothetical protein